MKVKNLIEIRKIFVRLANEPVNNYTAYKVMKFLKATGPYEDVFIEAQKKLIQDCAECDKDGNVIFSQDGRFTLKPDKIEKYTTEMKKIFDDEVEVNTKFKVEDFSSYKLSVADMLVLDEITEE